MRLLAAAAALVLLAGATTDPRRSGYDFMTPELQAMDKDDGANPAMLAVQDGMALWGRAAGTAGRSCADCHGAPAPSMRGVAARYPAYDERLGRVLSLRGRIAACQVGHQGAPASREGSDEALALEAVVALQSRGMAISPPTSAALSAAADRGERLFFQRMGQLDLSCAQCHDQHAGQRLGGSTIPQAHPTGYPIYRLEWQGMGSLQRRLRGCLSGVRAEPFASDAVEWVELEAYLARRAAGMKMDAPGVRP